jgi:hypothetical protein
MDKDFEDFALSIDDINQHPSIHHHLISTIIDHHHHQ